MSKEAMKLETIMEQAQVFASAWALVGGRFDNGNMLDEAEVAKNELREMVGEALAEQPAQQEPVAYIHRQGNHYEVSERFLSDDEKARGWTEEPLYTSPPAKQEPFEYWNAVEGWVKIDEVREHFDSVGCGTIYKSAGEGRAPLYTTPQPAQRQPLTDEEIYKIANDLFYGNGPCDTLAMCRAIEAAHGIKENT